jgi:hypothetical protein
MFSKKEEDFLRSIGATPQEIFDFVEPEFCTTMLISDSVLIATAWDLLPCCRMQRILCTAAA